MPLGPPLRFLSPDGIRTRISPYASGPGFEHGPAVLETVALPIELSTLKAGAGNPTRSVPSCPAVYRSVWVPSAAHPWETVCRPGLGASAYLPALGPPPLRSGGAVAALRDERGWPAGAVMERFRLDSRACLAIAAPAVHRSAGTFAGCCLLE
jgi:hypothetical protein